MSEMQQPSFGSFSLQELEEMEGCHGYVCPCENCYNKKAVEKDPDNIQAKMECLYCKKVEPTPARFRCYMDPRPEGGCHDCEQNVNGRHGAFCRVEAFFLKQKDKILKGLRKLRVEGRMADNRRKLKKRMVQVIFWDQAEFYFMCPGCAAKYQDAWWSGSTRVPNWPMQKKMVYQELEELQKPDPKWIWRKCEECRRPFPEIEESEGNPNDQ